MSIFKFDSPLMMFLGKIADLMILSVLWVLCCIPVVTIGPATAALYSVTLKMVRQKNQGIVKPFFHAFKDNLKQGIPLTIIFLLGAVILSLDYSFAQTKSGTFGNILLGIYVFLCVLYLMITGYTFPLIAQFRNTLRQTLKNALLFSISHIKTTLLLLAVQILPLVAMVVSIEVFVKAGILFLLLYPGATAYICSISLNKVFRPFMGETELVQ